MPRINTGCNLDAKVLAERERCVRIVEYAILESGDESRWLHRIRNQIANGLEPQTFRQQIEGELAAVRKKRKKRAR